MFRFLKPMKQEVQPLVVEPPASVGRGSWECVIEAQEEEGSLRWRQRTVELLRPQLEDRLKTEPEVEDFFLTCSPWHRAQFRRTSTSGPLSLQIRSQAPVSTEAAVIHRPELSATRLPSTSARTGEGYAQEVLPAEPLRESFERLVGLDDMAQELLVYLDCFCGDALARWGTKTGQVIPAPLESRFQRSVPLFLLYGDPGVGKSVLARGVVDAFCRQKSSTGALVSVGTEVRGSGLVGDFSQKLRGAFAAVKRLPETGLRVLVIDEAEAIAMRRSESAAHQEDRAATNTFLQCLDALQGERGIVVFLTSNRLEALDPALLRRCALALPLTRPGAEARASLLTTWLGQRVASDSGMVAACEGMTPADLENALMRWFLLALRSGEEPSQEQLQHFLEQAPRTQAVDLLVPRGGEDGSV